MSSSFEQPWQNNYWRRELLKGCKFFIKKFEHELEFGMAMVEQLLAPKIVQRVHKRKFKLKLGFKTAMVEKLLPRVTQ